MSNTQTIQINQLAGFIKFLEGKGLVELNIVGDDDVHFINRLKLQKYTLLAKYFGMPFHYQHDIYIYGPYSRQLAKDYYSLAEENRKQYDQTSKFLPDTFRETDFLNAVHNDPDWLEVATTFVDRRERIKERNRLIESVCYTKSNFGEPFIMSVLADLERCGLIVFHTVPH